jgi:ABC-2 type transport system permease protein
MSGMVGHTRSAAPVLALAKRSVLGTLRQPQAVIPSMVFPLFFTALNTASFQKTTHLPGFPHVHSFLDFALAAAVVQGILFGGTMGGTDLAIDIQDGFFDRLVVSPIPRWTILVGRLAGAAALGALQALFYTFVLVLFGAHVQGGAASIVSIVVIGTLFALGIGGVGLAVALRTGSSESVQATFPVVFIVMFLSSAFFPRNLMSGWFKAVAGVNPLSWLVEAMRNLTIVGFHGTYLVQGLAVAIGWAVLSIGLASATLRWRVAGE